MNNITSFMPHVTVAAVVERAGRFLMVRERAGGQQVINQPAGHWDPGESLIDAVIRETREETAWDFVPEALVGIYHWTSPQNQVTYLRFAFCGQVTEQHNHPLDDEIIEACWLTPAECQQQASQLRSPMVMQCMQDYLQGKRVPLDIVLALNLP